MLATMQALGVAGSFSRPGVSDDNPYSEALLRTLKYRPNFPSKPFGSIEEAGAWVAWFMAWYNCQHLHSSIGFVTPEQRHRGDDELVLKRRTAVYEAAKAQRPERWARNCRSSERIQTVRLNPEKPRPRRAPHDISLSP